MPSHPDWSKATALQQQVVPRKLLFSRELLVFFSLVTLCQRTDLPLVVRLWPANWRGLGWRQEVLQLIEQHFWNIPYSWTAGVTEKREFRGGGKVGVIDGEGAEDKVGEGGGIRGGWGGLRIR